MKIKTRHNPRKQEHRKKTDPYYNSKTHRKFRDAVWKKDKGICQGHKKEGKLKQLIRGTKDKDRQGVADHVIPREAGGLDTVDNGQLLCNSCHAKKSIEDKKYYK